MDWIGLDLTFPITDPTWIFLLVLLIILFAPILLNKLRIPHIIGMILAGLAVGEHGFNILARDSSFELFGKVGLYYIMFLAGLEMNMGDFKETRNKALVLGLLAFIVPIGIGFKEKHIGNRFCCQCVLSEIWCNHIRTASQYVCLTYPGGLSHCHPFRGVTSS